MPDDTDGLDVRALRERVADLELDVRVYRELLGETLANVERLTTLNVQLQHVVREHLPHDKDAA